jgi:CRISPR-associated protein Csb1
MFDELNGTPRLLLEQELRPVQGDRFQPTGFADLGAAVYETHNGTRMLLVESAQSVANRMEAACLDGNGPGIAPELGTIPYVRVKLTGATETETSSLMEAHRLNSPFIITDKGFQADFVERSGYRKGAPLNWKAIAAAVFYYDPSSILHGLFMANLGDGRVKLPRVVTGFIEARNIREAASGGVKNNPLDPTGTIRAAGYDKDVYGNVPYPRMEYTAERIAAYFNLDLAMIASYGFPPAASELLIALALYKIRRFLSHGLRLRTACDFGCLGNLAVQSPAGFAVPGEAELLATVQARALECQGQDLFRSTPLEITTECVVKAEKPVAEP